MLRLAANIRQGRGHLLARWQPRRCSGQWHPEKWQHIYDLATESIGLKDPYQLDEFAIKALAQALTDALAKQPLWLMQAIALLEGRQDFQLLIQLPRMGKPTAAAMLTAIGDVLACIKGQPLVKLAGRDVLVRLDNLPT